MPAENPFGRCARPKTLIVACLCCLLLSACGRDLVDPASARRLSPTRNLAGPTKPRSGARPNSPPVSGLANLPTVPASDVITFPFERKDSWCHQVEVGETVNEIARRYGTSAKKLRKHNVLAGATTLQPGQLLYIPR